MQISIILLLIAGLVYVSTSAKQLIIHTNGNGHVEISGSDPNISISCLRVNTPCKAITTDYRSELTINAFPDPGFQLTNWGALLECENPHKPCDLYMTEDKQLSVTFSPAPVIATVDQEGALLSMPQTITMTIPRNTFKTSTSISIQKVETHQYLNLLAEASLTGREASIFPSAIHLTSDGSYAQREISILFNIDDAYSDSLLDGTSSPAVFVYTLGNHMKLNLQQRLSMLDIGKTAKGGLYSVRLPSHVFNSNMLESAAQHSSNILFVFSSMQEKISAESESKNLVGYTGSHF